MRTGVILPVLLGFAVVLLSFGLFRSSKALSAIQSENAKMKLEVAQRVDGASRTQEIEPDVDDTKHALWTNQLSELNRLRGQVAAFTAREHALTNLLAENAARLKKLEQLDQEASRHETNRPATADTKRTATIRQFSNHSSPSISTNTAWSQQQIDAYRCANNLLQINIAATVWAQTHAGYAPADFVALQEYLAPMNLICPARSPRSLSVDWRDFDTSAITYRIPPPWGDIEWDGLVGGRGATQRLYAYCPIHQINSQNYPRMILFPSRYRSPIFNLMSDD